MEMKEETAQQRLAITKKNKEKRSSAHSARLRSKPWRLIPKPNAGNTCSASVASLNSRKPLAASSNATSASLLMTLSLLKENATNATVLIVVKSPKSRGP
jgi:hypothetical protein